MSVSFSRVRGVNTRVVGVATDDAMLYRKISLVLRNDAAVVEYSSDNEGGVSYDAILVDMRRDTRYDEVIKGAMPVVDRAQYIPGTAALPYPFAYSELRDLISGKELTPCNQKRLIPEGDGRHIRLDGERIKLTECEYRLLMAIRAGGGDFVSRESLCNAVWGDGADGGVLNVYVHYLREKLEARGEKIIISSRRGGYKIDGKYLGVCD